MKRSGQPSPSRPKQPQQQPAVVYLKVPSNYRQKVAKNNTILVMSTLRAQANMRGTPRSCTQSRTAQRPQISKNVYKMIICGFNFESFTFVDSSLMTSAFVVRNGKPAMFSYKQLHLTRQPCQNFLWYKLTILLQKGNQHE